MKKEFIVGFEDDKAKYIRTGTFHIGISNDSLLTEMISHCGTDWTGRIETFEKVIIGLLKRNPGNEAYVCEIMGGEWLRGIKEYYGNSTIKTRTEKEKEELIQKIRDDKY